jgi:hypothetical protein
MIVRIKFFFFLYIYLDFLWASDVHQKVFPDVFNLLLRYNVHDNIHNYDFMDDYQNYDDIEQDEALGYSNN